MRFPKSSYSDRNQKCSVRVLPIDAIEEDQEEMSYTLRIIEIGESPLLPEHHLCQAILERLIRDITKKQSTDLSIAQYKAALRYVRSESEHPWSLKWLCIQLDADYNKARRALELLIANKPKISRKNLYLEYQDIRDIVKAA
jgi:hypothetical protein